MQSGNTFSMLNNADLKFPTIKDEEGNEVEITHGRYISFLESEDRRVREEAFKGVYSKYGEFRNTFASTLSGEVKNHNFNATVRKYDSARQAAFGNNNIPEHLYDNLVKTVNDNLPLLHRYLDLRKKVLELDELHMYDLFTPLVKEAKMEVTYDEAKDYVLKGLLTTRGLFERFEKRELKTVGSMCMRTKGNGGAILSGHTGRTPYILMRLAK